MPFRTQLASLILLAGALLSPTLGAAQGSPTDLNKSIDMLVGDHVVLVFRVERLMVGRHEDRLVRELRGLVKFLRGR